MNFFFWTFFIFYFYFFNNFIYKTITYTTYSISYTYIVLATNTTDTYTYTNYAYTTLRYMYYNTININLIYGWRVYKVLFNEKTITSKHTGLKNEVKFKSNLKTTAVWKIKVKKPTCDKILEVLFLRSRSLLGFQVFPWWIVGRFENLRCLRITLHGVRVSYFHHR